MKLSVFLTLKTFFWLLCIHGYTCNSSGEFVDINYNVDSPYILMEKDSKHIHFNITIYDSDSLVMLAKSSDEEIVSVVSSGWYELNGNSSTNTTVKIRGVFLGRAYINFHVNKQYPTSLPSSPVLPKGGNSTILNVTEWYHISGEDFEVVVTREDTVLNTIFTATVIVLVCLANVAMGCKTDILVVRETLRKPIAPVTGLLSQFIIMPMVSFGVGRALNLDAPMAFGFFAMGCSPGGAASNIYTYLLDGDVSLSVTMTFISTVLSLAMIPMWLYTLGIHVIYNTNSITIPFVNIITSLLGLLLPVAIGVLIQKKKPRLAKKILLAVKPVTVIFVILVFTVGVYANLYIFKLLTPLVLLTGALIPYCGFAFGAFVAFIARQPKGRIMTIAIETGIQNSGIAIVLLQLSLPPPDSDIGVVGPIICTIFTPIPMAIAIVSYEIYKRCCKKKDDFDSIADKAQSPPDDKDKQLTALAYKPVHGMSNNAQTDMDNNSFERSSDNVGYENNQQHEV